MADIELDAEIKDKLKNNFAVSYDEINKMLHLFNKTIKPVIKRHYLSHLVASIEEIINDKRKMYFLTQLCKLSPTTDAEKIENLKKVIKQERIFTISLIAVPCNGKKARTYKKTGGVIICYADYLSDTEKRFAIAHELGYIVNNYIFDTDNNDNEENRASLFAYIALLDKNNFYQTECSQYIAQTDMELFNEYKNELHIKAVK